MKYKNELLDGWVGTPVVIKYADAPDLDPEQTKRAFEQPGRGVRVIGGMNRTAVYRLLAYDATGLTVRAEEEGTRGVFMPWGPCSPSRAPRRRWRPGSSSGRPPGARAPVPGRPGRVALLGNHRPYSR